MSTPIETIKVERSSGETREYMLRMLPADTGLRTSLKLAALLATPVGNLLAGAMGLKKPVEADPENGAPFAEADIAPDVLAAAVSSLGLSLADPALIDIVETMMSTVERVSSDGKGSRQRHAIVYATEFQGEYGALWAVALEALKINFRSFFSTGPAKGLLSTGQTLGASFLRRASTGGSQS